MQPELRARVDRVAVNSNGRSLYQLLKGKRYIGLHIRRGDACPNAGLSEAGSLHRYCPRSLQRSYGYWLSLMSSRYGVNIVYMATDSLEAEQWCASMRGRIECHIMAMNRTVLSVGASFLASMRTPRDHSVIWPHNQPMR